MSTVRSLHPNKSACLVLLFTKYLPLKGGPPPMTATWCTGPAARRSTPSPPVRPGNYSGDKRASAPAADCISGRRTAMRSTTSSRAVAGAMTCCSTSKSSTGTAISAKRPQRPLGVGDNDVYAGEPYASKGRMYGFEGRRRRAIAFAYPSGSTGARTPSLQVPPWLGYRTPAVGACTPGTVWPSALHLARWCLTAQDHAMARMLVPAEVRVEVALVGGKEAEHLHLLQGGM